MFKNDENQKKLYIFSHLSSLEILFNKFFDQSLTYVGITRHKESLQMYVPKDRFKDLQDLAKTCGRAGFKEMAIDFAEARGINVDDKVKEQSIFTTVKNNVFSTSHKSINYRSVRLYLTFYR